VGPERLEIVAVFHARQRWRIKSRHGTPTIGAGELDAMKTTTTVAALVVLGALVGASVHPHAQSDDPATLLIGTWRLVSHQQRLADGTTRDHPLSVGYLMYTDTGHMCAALMNPSRPKWNVAKPPTMTTDQSEALSAIAGFDGYCSAVEIKADGSVLHHVEVSARPNLVGTVRKRWFTFQGRHRVSLRVDGAELLPPVVEQTLVWERVQK